MVRVCAAIVAAVLSLPAVAQAGPPIMLDQNGRASYETVTRAFGLSRSFERWDRDGNGLLSRAEFRAGVGQGLPANRREFRAWDRDGSGQLSQRELTLGLFTMYDRDVDDWLTSDEVRALGAAWGLEVVQSSKGK